MKKILGAVFLGVLLNSAVQGQVLLTVDISDPSVVTIAATGAAPAVDGAIGTFYGITLVGFLTSTQPTSNSEISGNLLGNGASAFYIYATPISYSSGDYSTGPDLNIFNAGTSGTQSFTTLSPAFSGAGVLDLTAFLAGLPSVGASGDIRVGDGTTAGSVIGTYSVIPEPATVGMMILGGCATVFLRPRKRAMCQRNLDSL